MLREASEAFIHILTKKPALEPLYKNRHMVVEIQSEKESVWIDLNKGISKLVDNKPETVDVSISGPQERINELFNGSERLLLLQREGYLDIKGSQNHLLALESLFLLTGAQSCSPHNH